MHTIAVKAFARSNRDSLEYRLRSLGGLLASLGATPGDSLCLEPTGPLAVRASLVTTAPAPAQQQEQAGGGGQQEQAAAVADVPAAASLPPQAAEAGPSDPALGPAVPAPAAPAAALPAPAASAPLDEGAMWLEAARVLAALQSEGGVAPALVGAYRHAFAGLSHDRWRQAHLTVLQGFAGSSNWAAAADWMRQECRSGGVDAP